MGTQTARRPCRVRPLCHALPAAYLPACLPNFAPSNCAGPQLTALPHTRPPAPPVPPPAVSVALPEWFFSKDKQTAPLILLVLLFGGIVTPLGVAAWYLMGTQK